MPNNDLDSLIDQETHQLQQEEALANIPTPGQAAQQPPLPTHRVSSQQSAPPFAGRPLGGPGSFLSGVRTGASDLLTNARQYARYAEPLATAGARAVGWGSPGMTSFEDVMNQNAAETHAMKARPPASTALGGLGEATPGLAATLASGPRLFPQAIIGGAMGALDPAEGIGEVGTNAGLGAGSALAMQGLLHGLVKGAKAAKGYLGVPGAEDFDPIKDVYDYAKTHGVTLSAADVARNPVLSKAETATFHSPTADQADQVGNLVTGGGKSPNALADLTRQHYGLATDQARNAYAALDAATSQAGLPGVVPRKTYAAIQALSPYRDTIKNIDNKAVRDQILAIMDTPPNQIPRSMSFSDLDELRRSIGPVMNKIQMQAASPSSNITAPNAGLWKDLYGKVTDDLNTWGGKMDANSPWHSPRFSTALTQPVVDAFQNSREIFKNQVLPFRNNDLASSLIDGEYDGSPEKMVKYLTRPGNKTLVDNFKGLFPTDHEARKFVDTITAARRGSKEFGSGTATPGGASIPGWVAPSVAVGAASALPQILSHPGAAAATAGGIGLEQLLMHLINKDPAKSMLMAKGPQSRLGNLAGRGALSLANQEMQSPDAMTEDQRIYQGGP